MGHDPRKGLEKRVEPEPLNLYPRYDKTSRSLISNEIDGLRTCKACLTLGPRWAGRTGRANQIGQLDGQCVLFFEQFFYVNCRRVVAGLFPRLYICKGEKKLNKNESISFKNLTWKVEIIVDRRFWNGNQTECGQ